MRKKVLLIDNYDSFTYNLVQLVEEVTGERPDVVRNDALNTININDYSHFILSPGPGLPSESGDLKKMIGTLALNKKPMLGVCLGQQAIAEQFGGSLVNLDKVYHGIGSKIKIVKKDSLFDEVPKIFEAGRYHSWIVERSTFPEALEVLCDGPEGEIMALRHKTLPIWGVQFHPESILTREGKKIISNFLNKAIA